MTPQEALNKAIEIAGGKVAVSEFFGIKLPAVYQWEKAPANRVLGLEELTRKKISRHELRPDIFGAPKPRKRREAA
jgi:DNA-binding transcriptional regulator YdaS (Cro superfamily)